MKATVYILTGGIIIALSIFILGYSRSNNSSIPANNVEMVDGKQIIEIEARGGYNPRVSTAKAGVPTIVRFKTDGSFDCSSAIRIPSLGISQLLPRTGSTDIDIGSSTPGKLSGTCGMGMYRFEINFQG